MRDEDLIQSIDAVLPQTQCTRCGYPSCRAYATAIASGAANINQCPPGGNLGIAKLANLLDREILPLNPKNGVIKPIQLAIIEEDSCIGCTLCIKACPVDCIIGSNKMMHTIIGADCTGCELCLPACPVDCIILVDNSDQSWGSDKKDKYRNRYHMVQNRVTKQKQEKEHRLAKQVDLLKKVRAGDSSESSAPNDYIKAMMDKLSK